MYIKLFIIKLFIEMDKVEMLKSIYEVIETQSPRLFNMGNCVLIWNVLEYLYSDWYKYSISVYNDPDDLIYFNWWVGSHVITLMRLWLDLTMPIDLQSIDCIIYVYSLIKSVNND